MDKANFEETLDELVNEFGSVPDAQQKSGSLGGKGEQSRSRVKRGPEHVQESLDYIRVGIKYVMFDLEATRRENKYLKKLLEDNRGS
jgi:hypothetical protein